MWLFTDDAKIVLYQTSSSYPPKSKGQTDSPVEIFFAEKHHDISESNVNSGKTNSGETTAQFAFPAIKSGHLKIIDECFELTTLSWEHGFEPLRSPRLSCNAN